MLAQPPLPELLHVEPASAIYADALLREAASVAALSWGKSGQTPCTDEIYVYDAVDGEVARGDEPGCRIYFDRDFRNDSWKLYTDRKAGLKARRFAAAQICAVAKHEEGHNLGYGHIAGTIMNEVVNLVPVACSRWARLKLPYHKPTRH